MVKHILNYLKRMRDYMLMYKYDELVPFRYMNSYLQSNRDYYKSISRFVFTIKVKYVVDFEAAKEAFWLRKYLIELCVVPLIMPLLILFCDNSDVMTQSKESRNNQKGKHIERKYHLICDKVMIGDVVVEKIAFA